MAMNYKRIDKADRLYSCGAVASVATLLIVVGIIGYTAKNVNDVHVLVKNSNAVMQNLRRILPEVEESLDILRAICENADLNVTC